MAFCGSSSVRSVTFEAQMFSLLHVVLSGSSFSSFLKPLNPVDERGDSTKLQLSFAWD